jgi:hypothetical protein
VVRTSVGGLLLATALSGCDRPPAAAPAAAVSTQPASSSAPAVVKAEPFLLPAADTWTTQECVARLAAFAPLPTASVSDDDAEPAKPSPRKKPDPVAAAAAASAAVRLARLAQIEPVCLPVSISDAAARSLRMQALDKNRWIVGRATPDPRVLALPVLIDATGAVMPAVDGAEEEACVAYVSRDADVFPHLLLTPLRVLLLKDATVDALCVRSLGAGRFAMRYRNDYPYVAIIVTLPQPASQAAEDAPLLPDEAARYTWDPYEESFNGPAADRLPDPPGGAFELDLKCSKALVPVGGKLPDPPKAPERPDRPAAQPDPQ